MNRLLSTDEAQFGENAELAGKGAVLVVKDCEPLLFYLNSALLQIGFQDIYLAASLEEAFAVWEQHKSGISHVLLNHGLPDGVGYELASKVLADRPDLSVVITTGGDLASIQEETANPNSFKYLQKPFRYTELRNLIQPQVQVQVGLN